MLRWHKWLVKVLDQHQHLHLPHQIQAQLYLLVLVSEVHHLRVFLMERVLMDFLNGTKIILRQQIHKLGQYLVNLELMRLKRVQ